MLTPDARIKHRVPWPFGPRGLPDPFKPPYSGLVAIDLNEGTIRWSVANGDGLRNHPAGVGLPPGGGYVVGVSGSEHPGELIALALP